MTTAHPGALPSCCGTTLARPVVLAVATPSACSASVGAAACEVAAQPGSTRLNHVQPQSTTATSHRFLANRTGLWPGTSPNLRSAQSPRKHELPEATGMVGDKNVGKTTCESIESPSKLDQLLVHVMFGGWIRLACWGSCFCKVILQLHQ